MAKKSTTLGVAEVAKGNAEIAIQPVSELLHVSGADFVGSVPVSADSVSRCLRGSGRVKSEE